MYTPALMTLIHSALAFFALAMTILSVFVKRSPWIWGSFLVLALVLGYMAKLVAPIALAPIGGLLAVQIVLKGDIRGLARFVLVVIATLLSLGLMSRSFPGFTGWPILQDVQVSKDAIPFSLYLNFSKPFIGIAVLIAGVPLIRDLPTFWRLLKASLPLILGGAVLMVLVSLLSGLMRFDPKFPPFAWFFFIQNLIFVSIIEEAFWRGFIQRELFRAFGEKGFWASVGCVLITSLAFAAVHWFWIHSLPFLGLACVAGVIFGTVYQCTRALEMSILTHWLFNMLYLTLLTYPMLAPKAIP